jgi:putative glutamine amidotransferase
MRPLIGITTAYSRAMNPDEEIPRYISYTRVAENIAAAGGLPVLIPSGVDEATLRALYDRLDGVVLPGGGDIDPKYWGEDIHPTVYGLDPERDQTEMTLARWAVAEDRPLFGICRGHQVVNVALGGSLIQDIPSQYTSELTHNNFLPIPRSHRSHVVGVKPESRLAHITGLSNAAPVNSIHHQAVREAAAGMVAVAYSPDGLIEATEMPDKRFVLTVQWHPEDLADDEAHFALFKAFVQASQGA